MVDKKSKHFLSKSQVGTYRTCPFKWKMFYKEFKREPESKYQHRGKKIHSEIEHFYKKVSIINGNLNISPKVDVELIKNFVEFEKKRFLECENKTKHFFPVFQELYIENKDIGMRGVIDAVYLNPKDDGIIVIDWKSGKYRPENFDDYRFELAFYKELLEKSDHIGCEVKYWGIYFVDADKLFFEKADMKYVNKMKQIVQEVKDGITNEKFKPKENKYCYFCGFKKECPLMKDDFQ